MGGRAGQSYWQRSVRRVGTGHEDHRRRLDCAAASGAFEQAERSSDPERRAKLLTFVVVGAGPTGVEMAGQIAELADHAQRARSATSTPPGPASSCSTRRPPCCRRWARNSARRPPRGWKKLGVEIQLGAMVTNVDRNGINVKYGDGTKSASNARPGVVGRGRGQPAGQDDRRPVRRRGGPCRARQGPSRPHRPRLPERLRRRGHGSGRGASRVRHRAPSRVPGTPPRPIKAELGGANPAAREPFQVLRQGFDGHGVAVFGGRAGRPDRIRRLHRLAGLAVPAPDLPRRLPARLTTALSWVGTFIGSHRGQPDHHRAAGLRPHQDRTTRGRSSRASSRKTRRSSATGYARAARAGWTTAEPEGAVD